MENHASLSIQGWDFEPLYIYDENKKLDRCTVSILRRPTVALPTPTLSYSRNITGKSGQVYGIDIATTNSGIAYADSFILKEHHRQVNFSVSG
jgi:hypothetical protein